MARPTRTPVPELPPRRAGQALEEHVYERILPAWAVLFGAAVGAITIVIVEALLDNITPTSRTAVERRLAELEDERQRLEAKVESLERLGMSKAEVRDLIQETTRFIVRLEPTLREGPLHERQAAMGRCVDKVEFNQVGGCTHVRARSIPRIVRAAETQVSGTVELLAVARVRSTRASG